MSENELTRERASIIKKNFHYKRTIFSSISKRKHEIYKSLINALSSLIESTSNIIELDLLDILMRHATEAFKERIKRLRKHDYVVKDPTLKDICQALRISENPAERSDQDNERLNANRNCVNNDCCKVCRIEAGYHAPGSFEHKFWKAIRKAGLINKVEGNYQNLTSDPSFVKKMYRNLFHEGWQDIPNSTYLKKCNNDDFDMLALLPFFTPVFSGSTV